MINVKVQDKLDFQVEIIDDKVRVNGKNQSVHIVKISEKRYHIIINNKSLEGELIEVNKERRRATWRISGKLVHTVIKDETDLIIDKIGMTASADKGQQQVHAPMPGLILELYVSAGDTVKKGAPLLVLKAMKMENIIRSPVTGNIEQVIVKAGQNVDKHAPLIQF